MNFFESGMESVMNGFPEPVMLLESEVVSYHNAAAEGLFPGLKHEKMVPTALVDFLPDGGEDSVALGEIDGTQFRISRQTVSPGSLIILRPTEGMPTPATPERVGFHLRKQLVGLTMALQRLNCDPKQLTAEEYERFLSMANQGFYRIMRLANHLHFLGESDRQCFRPTVLDLAGLCRELTAEFQSVMEGTKAEFSFQSDLSTLLVHGDSGLLRTMLLSLLSNAVKAVNFSGRFGLRLSRRGAYAILTVWDEGEAGQAVKLNRLFSATPDDSQPGDNLGLGLVIVRRIAALHKGTFVAEAQGEGGLRATVSIPIETGLEHFSVESPTGQYDHTGGFSSLLMELSPVLPFESFRSKELD